MESYDFQDLEALGRTLEELIERQVSSLAKYDDKESNGFRLHYDGGTKPGFSKSSTATCALSLLATGAWDSWRDRAAALAHSLLESEWETAGLEKDNVYTTAFVLEAVTALAEVQPRIETEGNNTERIAHAVDIIVTALAPGYVQHAEYPPSAYLTQLAVRVLRRRRALLEATERKVRDWATHEVDHQLALLVAKSNTADLFQLAYATMLVACLGDPGMATPEQHQIIQAAVDQLFEHQQDDGSWPRSLPLFHYPRYGSAYCYEYEMLVQLLQEPLLRGRLLRHLPKLGKAARMLRETAYQIGENGWGWSSGHHPQFPGPESWTTASVFHFAHALDRLVAEAMRRSIFVYLDQAYTGFQPPKKDISEFANPKKFLDCPLVVNGNQASLRETLISDFVEPLASEAEDIGRGRSFSRHTPMSAIFFGPPGTSKTELTREIAEYLGWPRLVIDPSHFVRRGMDQVQAEADRIFGMLAAAEQVVVLLDEFDEMARDRHHSSEILSRFLTTAMLPKLAAINKRRRLVFIVATNYIDHFDLAISRPGRLDRIFQVMPPTAEAKIEYVEQDRPGLAPVLNRLGRADRSKLDQLTFGEFIQWKSDIEGTSSKDDVMTLLNRHFDSCILNSRVDPQHGSTTTWASVCEEQRVKIRCSAIHCGDVQGDAAAMPVEAAPPVPPLEKMAAASSGGSRASPDNPAAQERLLDLPTVDTMTEPLTDKQRERLADLREQIEADSGRRVTGEELLHLEQYYSLRLSARSRGARHTRRPTDVELLAREEVEAELARLRSVEPEPNVR